MSDARAFSSDESALDRIASDSEIDSICAPGHRLWVVRDFRPAAEALGLGEACAFRAAIASGRAVAGGRADHRLLALSKGQGTLRLRPARHGGVFGSVFGGRYLSPMRASRELALWLALRRCGVALPTPVAAIATRDGVFWSCHFAALEREQAQDGLAWLATNPSDALLRRGAIAFAGSLRRLHDAGVVHGDLNLRNVLLEATGRDGGEGSVGSSADPLACLFVDLDHGRRRTTVPPRARLEELARLARSLEKHGLDDRIGARLRARVVLAYCGGDRRLRDSMWASTGRERRRLARHRLAWRAGRALGALGALAGLGVLASALARSA